MQDWFDISKSDQNHHLNRRRKVIWQKSILTHEREKPLSKLRIKRNFLYQRKSLYEKITANILLSSGRRNVLPETEGQTRISFFTASIQPCIRGPRKCSKARKIIKTHNLENNLNMIMDINKKKNKWNIIIYVENHKESTRPLVGLLAKVKYRSPRRLLDLRWVLAKL